jgi:beta-glucosidase
MEDLMTSLCRCLTLCFACAPLALSACSSAPPSQAALAREGIEELDATEALAHSIADPELRGNACSSIAPAPHYADWPRIRSAIRQDPGQEAWIRRVVGAMTLEQKVGQMTQAEILSVYDAATQTYSLSDFTAYNLGSVLGGGGTWPEENKHASLQDWVALTDAVWEAGPNLTIAEGSHTTQLHVPLLWGEDMVHNLQPVYGATLYPHNIGLGATRDTCLARDLGAATARGTRAVGVDWTFSPCLAVVRDDRWGRTYESFSEDPGLVRALATATTEGLMDVAGSGTSFRGIASTAKHYLADGGSIEGIDQGIIPASTSESDLINLHAQGYFGTLDAGAQTVMVGYFATEDGGRIVGDKHLVDDILKQKMGFDGFVISDYNAIANLPNCNNADCPQAVNAGIDMFMVPYDWKAFITNTVAEVRAGVIPMARINDAVTRILRVKVRAGLFAEGKPSQRRFAGDASAIAPRELARQAVRESLVLLKNNGNVLPLERHGKLLVVGKSADSLENQTGGWSLTWQGGPTPWAPDDHNLNSDFPNGQSILAGIQAAVGAGHVTFSVDGAGIDVRDYDAVIAVIGEVPYSEVYGDVATANGNWRHDPADLSVRTLEHGHRYPEDRALLQALGGQGVPVVTVLLSGRPLYVNAELNLSDAFVAAWLPGTEGGGIADLLFRQPSGSSFNFSGKLPVSWPRSACQTAVNVGDADYHPQFPFGYGLSYPTRLHIGKLDQTAGPVGGCTS